MKKKIIIWMIVIFLGSAYFYFEIPDDRFWISFLNVGQGDAIFIKTPENHQILVDGGPDNFVLEQLSGVMPFFDSSLDLVVLTHPDSDHVSGLTDVLKRYEVGAVLMTGIVMKSNLYDEFLKELGDIPVFVAEAEQDFLLGEVGLDILYPFENISGEEPSSVNNSSIVIRVDYLDTRILLTGDLEIEGEISLLERGADIKADLYKAGHHGSRSSSSLHFVQKISPRRVVISSGKENKFGHPHPETVRTFYQSNVEEIYRTDLDGRVDFFF